MISALVVVAVVVASCLQARRASGPRVLVIGDSLVSLTKPDLTDRLEGAGWRPTIRGFNGRTIAEVGAETRSLRAERWDAVAVWAGHNDVGTLQRWGTGQANVLSWAASQPCTGLMEIPEIYLLDVYVPGVPRATLAKEVNGHFAELARRDPSVRLVPWAATSDDRPELLVGDRLHVNRRGAVVVADRIARALAACPSAPGR